MTRRYIASLGTAAALFLFSPSAMADPYDPGSCGEDAHSVRSGKLGKIGKKTISYHADTCGYDDRQEFQLKVIIGKKEQVLDAGAHGSTAASYYNWSLKGNVLKLSYPCGSRYDDENQSCVSLWQWQPKTQLFKHTKTTATSPYARALKKIKTDLKRGKIKRAYRALKKLPSSSNGGHTDNGNELLGMFIESTHKKAFALYRAKKPKQAAKLVELVVDAPPHKDDDNAKLKTHICFDKKCKDKYNLDGQSANTRRLVDMAFFLDEVGKHEQAYGLLKQLSPHLTGYAPVWLNLADAAWSIGKKQEAQAAYKKYQSLRANQKKAVPQRVKQRLKTP